MATQPDDCAQPPNGTIPFVNCAFNGGMIRGKGWGGGRNKRSSLQKYMLQSVLKSPLKVRTVVFET